MKKRFLKILAITCTVMLVLAATTAIAAVIGMKKLKATGVAFDKSKLSEVYTCLTVLDKDGERINEPMYLNGYKQIPLDALHDYTYNAFVAVEDKRFFDHSGIDVKRVFGALLHNVASRSYKEGASTISQQLIKNTHLDNSKTLRRKVNEMLLARELEQNYSKKEILEMYLNTIYFGRSAYGIETAANVYFNKSAADLTVAESATLAGMIKAPNNYAPDINKDKCKTRRNMVLELMYEQEYIGQEQYLEACASEITYCPETVRSEKTYIYHVIKEACRILNMSPMQLYRSDFVIETYCNQQIQRALYDLAEKDRTLNKQGDLAQLSCIVCDNCGGVEACFLRGESADSRRQVGSALKPIAVYTPALNEKIITQASPVLDEETDFNGYKPTNAGGYNGWTTIKYAVAKSLNVPAVKTLNALGLDAAQKYLGKLGISGKQNLSLALGNADGGIDLYTLAKCYTTLANNGAANDTAFIKSIYSEKGLVYSRNLQNKRVFASEATYLMTDMLVNTVSSGTAKLLANKKVQIAAKTGTVGNSEGNTDALVAGYTPQDTFVVWYSGDLSNEISGSTAPCQFACRLIGKMYPCGLDSKFAQPQGVVLLDIDKNSLYNKQLVVKCDSGEKFWFDISNQPTQSVPKMRNYTLSAEVNGNNVTVTLPNADGVWQLYKTVDGTNIRINVVGNCVCDELTEETSYFAELYQGSEKVYTTPKIKVCPLPPDEPSETEGQPAHDERDELEKLLDYWYLK